MHGPTHAHATSRAAPAQRPPAAWRGARPPQRIQARLRVGAAHDDAEKQADRIAAAALKKSVPPGVSGAAADAARSSDGRSAVRRTLAPAEERLLAPPDEEQALPEALEREIAALQAGGQPLPPPLRAEMGWRLGLDLSPVRIHTDGRAARLNQALHAHAFTVGEHVAFDAGRFQPDTGPGRFLLAHELAHVAQQRGEPATTGAAAPAKPVRRGFWGDLYDSVADTLGDVADWAADQVRDFGWRLLESVSPEFARTVRAIVDEGLLNWLGRQVARAWDAYIATLRALVPFDGPRQLIDLFAGLVERAAHIVAALTSGQCEPLMAAIAELRSFVTETVGVAWDRLTEFLRPIGEFFSGLWTDFGAPALRWLQDFGGDVWQGIQDLGQRLWDWIRPVRDAAARIWNWFSGLLFGPSEGEDSTGSQGGVVGWISRKAGEAWDWIRERTRPVWQPVSEVAQQVAELIPPAFVRQMGEQAQQLSAGLDEASAGMDGGEGVPQARETLASVLPSVQTIVAAVRGLIVGAGQWLGDRIAGVADLLTGLVGRLQASQWLSWLASAFGGLVDAAGQLLAWAREKVAVLFGWMVQGFDALTPFIETVLQTVRRVIGIYADLLQLPGLILGSLWQRVPPCIREPIEDFVQTQILARIPVFGQFFSDPGLWPRVQQTALGILRRIFVDGDIVGAAWAFFQAVLGILGIPAQLVVQILAKAARAIGDILSNPLGFLVNTLRAMRAGFGLFFGNIARHLLGGVTGWLFGQLRDAGVQPPADFSLRSVLGFVFQVLGITADNIFRRLAARVGEGVVTRLRQMLHLASGAWEFVSILVTEGPAALWATLRERLSDLWTTVIQGAIGWVTEVVTTRVSTWLLSLLDPTGVMAVVNSLIAIYNAIESFVEYLRQMLEIVSRVLDGVLDIARGVIDAAAGHLENALASALPVAIGFLANQLGLGRLSARIREILQRVQGVVDGAIDWLIDRAIRLGQAVLDMARRGVTAVRGAAGRLREWWRERVGFTGRDGRPHTLHFQGEGAQAELIIESTPMGFQTFLDSLPDTADPADKRLARRLYAELRTVQRLPRAGATPAPGVAPPGAGTPDNDAEILRLTHALGEVAGRLMPASSVRASSQPRFGTLSDGFGHSVDVETLTSNIPPGSEPSVDSALWNRLRRRRVGEGTYYIAGHLLNHHLGGPGATWANLAPITRSANTTMSSQVEERAKTAVEAGAHLHFHVEAVYPRPLDRSRALLAEITAAAAAGPLTPELTAKKDVIEAEQVIPEKLLCTVRKVGFSGATDPTVTERINHPIDNGIREATLDQYEIDGAAYDPEAEFLPLRQEVRDVLAATPDLSWTSFRDTGRAGRIERLDNERREDLRQVFVAHHRPRRLAAEQAAIDALTAATTWTEFARGRSAYDGRRAEDERLGSDQIPTLQAHFGRHRQAQLMAAVDALTAPETWGAFRLRERAIASDGGLTADQVTAVQDAFNARVAALASR